MCVFFLCICDPLLSIHSLYIALLILAPLWLRGDAARVHCAAAVPPSIRRGGRTWPCCCSGGGRCWGVAAGNKHAASFPAWAGSSTGFQPACPCRKTSRMHLPQQEWSGGRGRKRRGPWPGSCLLLHVAPAIVSLGHSLHTGYCCTEQSSQPISIAISPAYSLG